MITFLVIKNKNRKNSQTVESIKNNYDIEKYNYDIIETSSENIDLNIVEMNNKYLIIINEPHYFNTVMLEDLFDYINKYNEDVYMAPFLHEINNLEYKTENFYYGDTDVFNSTQKDEMLNSFQTHTPCFIINKNFIIDNNIKYINESQFCKDVYKNINKFVYVRDIDFLFFKHNILKITADDFGMTSGINKGIVECFDNEVITQASLMTNQKYTEEALDMIIKNKLKNIGLHFNITQGVSLYDDSVIFSKEQHKNLSKEFIENEFNCQLQVMLDRDIIPTYIDMHHNVNFYSDYIQNIILKYGIPIRKEENCYTGLYNNITKESLLEGFSYSEIMTHPAYVDEDLKILSKYTDSRKIEMDFLISNKDTISSMI